MLHQSGHGHSHGGLSSNHGHSHDEESAGHGHSHDSKGDKKKAKVNINVRAAFIHVLGDLVQSVGVLIAAIIIKVQVSAGFVECFLFSAEFRSFPQNFAALRFPWNS